MATTVKQILADYAAGTVTFDRLLANFSSRRDFVVAPRAASMEDMYAQAEEWPADNDTFWINSAFTGGKITDKQYTQLFAAVRAGRAKTAARADS